MTSHEHGMGGNIPNFFFFYYPLRFLFFDFTLDALSDGTNDTRII
jgi:hypothetical protein